MRAELLEYLVCPKCGAAIDLHPFVDDTASAQEIEHGLLVCRGCAVPYPLAEGIPRLLPNAFRRQQKFRRDFSSQLSLIAFRESPSEKTRKFEPLHRLPARPLGSQWNTYRCPPPPHPLPPSFSSPNTAPHFS